MGVAESGVPGRGLVDVTELAGEGNRISVGDGGLKPGSESNTRRRCGCAAKEESDQDQAAKKSSNDQPRIRRAEATGL